MKDVAEAASVSIKTVSRVINDEPNVKGPTAERVREIIGELGFVPNQAARSLRSARSYAIALIGDDPNADYIADIQRGVLEVCRARGYHLIVEPYDQADWATGAGAQAPLSKRGLDGAILLPPLSQDDELIERLTAVGLTVGVISSPTPSPLADAVGMDERGATTEITNHLLSLGHRRLGFIAHRASHGHAATRREAFLAAARAAGLTDADIVVRQGDSSFAAGRLHGADMLDLGTERPTGIVAANDHMAAGVVAVAHERGMSVPADLSVVGFDGAVVSEMVWPPLTTIMQPCTAFGRHAASMLLDRLRDPGLPFRCETLAHQLLVRGSAGPAPSD